MRGSSALGGWPYQVLPLSRPSSLSVQSGGEAGEGGINVTSPNTQQEDGTSQRGTWGWGASRQKLTPKGQLCP